MDVSLRAPFTATVVSVVIGASVVAVPPTVVDPQSISRPSVSGVALRGFDNPLPQFVDAVLLINNDLFNGTAVYGDYEWQPFQGLIPQFVYTALPILSQLTYNWSAYIGGSVDALGTLVKILGDAAWDLPAAIVTATRQAIDGEVAEAITTLTDATIVPLKAAAAMALAAGQAVLGSVGYNLRNVAATLSGITQGLLHTTVGALTAVSRAAATIATQTLTALAEPDLQAAWNTVVDGLFGPVGADGTVASSLPGTIEAVTLGPGLGPSGFPNGYAVPSLRMWAEQSQLQLANAVGANYPVPPSAQSASPASAGATPVRKVPTARSARPAADHGARSANVAASRGTGKTGRGADR